MFDPGHARLYLTEAHLCVLWIAECPRECLLVGLSTQRSFFEQKRSITMRLKKLFVAVVAVSIVHALGALGPLFAQPAAGPAGNAARGAGRADAQRPGEVSVSTVVVVKNLNSAVRNNPSIGD